MFFTTAAPRPATGLNSQDLKRRAAFAKAAVYLEFRGRDAKAVDQDAFTDHSPQQIRRWRSEAIARRQAVLDQLAATLRLDGDGAAARDMTGRATVSENTAPRAPAFEAAQARLYERSGRLAWSAYCRAIALQWAGRARRRPLSAKPYTVSGSKYSSRTSEG